MKTHELTWDIGHATGHLNYASSYEEAVEDAKGAVIDWLAENKRDDENDEWSISDDGLSVEGIDPTNPVYCVHIDEIKHFNNAFLNQIVRDYPSFGWRKNEEISRQEAIDADPDKFDYFLTIQVSTAQTDRYHICATKKGRCLGPSQQSAHSQTREFIINSIQRFMVLGY